MKWTQGLNPEQVEAVLHVQGPLLILAGAGSGKTTVLVSRTGHLITQEKIAAERICVLTFTNKAARELKHRVMDRMGESATKVWAGTFHSFGLHLLKRFHRHLDLPPHFGILDTTDSVSVVRELMKEIRVVGKDKFDLDKVLNLIQRRRTGQHSENEPVDEYTELAETLTPKYEKRLQLLGVVDFESLLLKPLELITKYPEVRAKIQNQFEQLMVDEFQDTNIIQMKLIQELVAVHRNLTVVGDDDQSIYGWRGAEVKNILQFPQLYKPCRVIKLERNYRSQAAILNLANDVISKNHSRHGKILKPQKLDSIELPEVFVLDNEDAESEFVTREIELFLKQGFKPSEIAVLYRANTQGAFLESHLRRHQIPYAISGGTSIFDRKEAKDILAFLKQALSPNDVSLKRIINLPARGLGDTSLEKLADFAKAHKISFFEACKQWSQAGLQDKAGRSLESWLDYLRLWPQRLLKGNSDEVSLTVGARLLKTLEEIGYKREVYESSTAPGAGEKKWMIAEIVCRILDSFLLKRDQSLASLREFIDVMTLKLEDDEESQKAQVQLMTLHASKGLEFPVVFLMGLEEDLLPHRNLGQNIDEERRLFYVGMTRAQKKLIMTRAQTRKRHGTLRPSAPSRFLLEMNSSLYKEYPQGVRPVSGEDRDKMVAQFLASLNNLGPQSVDEIRD